MRQTSGSRSTARAWRVVLIASALLATVGVGFAIIQPRATGDPRASIIAVALSVAPSSTARVTAEPQPTPTLPTTVAVTPTPRPSGLPAAASAACRTTRAFAQGLQVLDGPLPVGGGFPNAGRLVVQVPAPHARTALEILDVTAEPAMRHPPIVLGLGSGGIPARSMVASDDGQGLAVEPVIHGDSCGEPLVYDMWDTTWRRPFRGGADDLLRDARWSTYADTLFAIHRSLSRPAAAPDSLWVWDRWTGRVTDIAGPCGDCRILDEVPGGAQVDGVTILYGRRCVQRTADLRPRCDRLGVAETGGSAVLGTTWHTIVSEAAMAQLERPLPSDLRLLGWYSNGGGSLALASATSVLLIPLDDSSTPERLRPRPGTRFSFVGLDAMLPAIQTGTSADHPAVLFGDLPGKEPNGYGWALPTGSIPRALATYDLTPPSDPTELFAVAVANARTGATRVYQVVHGGPGGHWTSLSPISGIPALASPPVIAWLP